MGEGKVESKWDPKDSVQFTYKRSGNQGDIEVYATSIADAVETLKIHGFKNIDLKKLTRTGRTLAEYLAEAKAREPID